MRIFAIGCGALSAAQMKPQDTQAVKAWPTGKMGDLVVSKDKVVTFAPGIVYDYQSITVDQGGTIEVQPGIGWTIVLVKGDFNLQGKIIARLREDPVEKFQEIKSNAPDGSTFEPDRAERAGGAGGNPGGCGLTDGSLQDAGHGSVPAAGSGGAPAAGNGGGGGAYGLGNGSAADATKGGDGGTSQLHNPGDEIGKSGLGADGFAGNGEDGQAADGPNKRVLHFGGGGGGGSRGRNGGLLYIFVAGKFNGSGGTVDISGENGGNGGSGGRGSHAKPASGGGGGAGGDGGVLYIRYGTGFSPSQFIYSGGKGGVGGLGGVSGNAGQAACPGTNGKNGLQGQVRIGSIPAPN